MQRSDTEVALDRERIEALEVRMDRAKIGWRKASNREDEARAQGDTGRALQFNLLAVQRVNLSIRLAAQIDKLKRMLPVCEVIPMPGHTLKDKRHVEFSNVCNFDGRMGAVAWGPR